MFGWLNISREKLFSTILMNNLEKTFIESWFSLREKNIFKVECLTILTVQIGNRHVTCPGVMNNHKEQ